MKTVLVKNTKTGVIDVFVNEICFGAFDILDGDLYRYFPKRNDQLTGDHYIAIGESLNKINNTPFRAASHVLGKNKVEPLTSAGQVNVGDTLIIDDGKEVKSHTAKIVINAGTEKEEIVLRKKKNLYFIISMYLSGQSWAKDACIVRQAK